MIWLDTEPEGQWDFGAHTTHSTVQPSVPNADFTNNQEKFSLTDLDLLLDHSLCAFKSQYNHKSD